MIIMMCGKGGCGKSTITSLLAKEYERRGKNVMVVDSDESNFGLHRLLGMELPEDFTHYFGSKKGIFRRLDEREDKEASIFPQRWGLEDLPGDFVSRKGRIRLMAVGKIHEASEGCACAMGTTAKELLGNLQLTEQDIVLVDTEAGVEHFGRGVDRAADAILMVVDPSYESIALAGKISDMCRALDKPLGFIINKADAQQTEILRDSLADDRVMACLEANRELMKEGLLGQELSVTVPGISDLADRLA